jgi:hypothetical protein
MFPVAQQFSAATKAQLEAQLKIIHALTSQAFDSAEKIFAMNINATKAAIEKSSAVAHQLFAPGPLASGPRAQPVLAAMLAHGRNLPDRRSDAAIAKPAAAEKPAAAVKPATVAAKPVVAKPVAEKSVAATPVVAKQVVAKPVAEKPVVAKPVVAKPIAAVKPAALAAKPAPAAKPAAKVAVAKPAAAVVKPAAVVQPAVAAKPATAAPAVAPAAAPFFLPKKGSAPFPKSTVQE